MFHGGNHQRRTKACARKSMEAKAADHGIQRNRNDSSPRLGDRLWPLHRETGRIPAGKGGIAPTGERGIQFNRKLHFAVQFHIAAARDPEGQRLRITLDVRNVERAARFPELQHLGEVVQTRHSVRGAGYKGASGLKSRLVDGCAQNRKRRLLAVAGGSAPVHAGKHLRFDSPAASHWY
jgi:hypothetical protein